MPTRAERGQGSEEPGEVTEGRAACPAWRPGTERKRCGTPERQEHAVSPLVRGRCSREQAGVVPASVCLFQNQTFLG